MGWGMGLSRKRAGKRPDEVGAQEAPQDQNERLLRQIYLVRDLDALQPRVTSHHWRRAPRAVGIIASISSSIRSSIRSSSSSGGEKHGRLRRTQNKGTCAIFVPQRQRQRYQRVV